MLTQNALLTDFICFNSANTDDLTLTYDLPLGVTQVSAACVGPGGGSNGGYGGGGGGGVAVMDNYPVPSGSSLQLVLGTGGTTGIVGPSQVAVVAPVIEPFVIGYAGQSPAQGTNAGGTGGLGQVNTGGASLPVATYQGGNGGSGE
jgi:hypothetical protein